MTKNNANGKSAKSGKSESSGTLRDAFIDEVRDSYDAEKQLIKALPKLAAAASSPDLAAAFTAHLAETREHVSRLEQVFKMLGEKVQGKHCDGIAGIIEEGGSVMEEDFNEATMDACIIAGAQRAEHYEISAYGTLIVWAFQLGLDDAAELLKLTLGEEEAADKKLTSLAEGGINQAAAEGASNAEADDEAGVTGRSKQMGNIMAARQSSRKGANGRGRAEAKR